MDALADLVVLIHVTFVLFVALGGLLALRWPGLSWVHIPALIWGVVIECAGFICPLTPLEVALRERSGGTGYRGGFIEHYVAALLYPSGLTREVQFALGTAVLLVNVLIYSRLLASVRRGKPELTRRTAKRRGAQE